MGRPLYPNLPKAAIQAAEVLKNSGIIALYGEMEKEPEEEKKEEAPPVRKMVRRGKRNA